MGNTGTYGFLAGLLAAVLAVPSVGQNLLQNPGFEDSVAWDNFWFLSTLPPSGSSATAVEYTKDSHGGSSCLELSNTDGNKWTYFYSDSLRAPLSFLANKSYEVSCWMKPLEAGRDAELSVNWNGSREMVAFFTGSPDPVSQPDWFQVRDTITPGEDFADGYLRLAFRTGKDKNKSTGRLLLDDLSVIRIPDNTATRITEFSIARQTGPAWINPVSATVFLEVVAGTDVTSLVPELIGLSRGATIHPEAGDTVDFTVPVTFTVTAQDETTTRDWTVIVLLAPSTEAEILAFDIDRQTAPALIDSIQQTVSLEVAYGTDLTSLAPSIVISSGATILPASGDTLDFTGPVTYRVTAEDGATFRDWTVTVTEAAPMTETDITSFSVPGQLGDALIDPIAHTVAAEVPYGTDLTHLVPVITVSEGAAVTPASGVVQDFTDSVTYTVTAQDGTTTQTWSVTVKEHLSHRAQILHFGFKGQNSTSAIDTSRQTVTVEVPFGTDLSSMVPEITVSRGATVVPDSGVARDFSSPVTYTVTAQDGVTVKEWIVEVVFLPNTEAFIVAFHIPGQAHPAVIDQVALTVEVEMSPGTGVSSLVPGITVSPGATVVPDSGVARNFSSPVTYTVTAQDGVTVNEWRVTVKVLPHTEADILSFSLNGQDAPAEIDTGTQEITLALPYGTDVAALVPAMEISAGATVDPEPGVPTDFSEPVIYTVTAEDGITVKEWTVTVRVLPNTEAKILSFVLEEQTGPAFIDDTRNAISIEVEKGTDITTLAPAVEVSPGATVDPPSGTRMDFTTGRVYTVTAADGVNVREWAVTVTMDPAVSNFAHGPKASAAPSIYPNPASEYITVETGLTATLSIRDLSGRLRGRYEGITGKQIVPLANMESGIYIAEVERNGYRWRRRFMVR